MSPRRIQLVKDAILLSAGFGTRMGETGKTLPKPLFELGGKPLIQHVLDRMQAAGITRVAINVHHCAERLESYLAMRSNPQPKVLVSREHDRLLDTGGGILQALHLLEPGTTGPGVSFVHNCDAFWLPRNYRTETADDFMRMSHAWDSERMDGLLLLEPVQEGAQADFFMEESGEESNALHPGEKKMGKAFRYTGVQIVSSRLFGGAIAGNAFPVQPLWQQAIERGRLQGLEADSSQGQWLHVGTAAALAYAENLLPRGE